MQTIDLEKFMQEMLSSEQTHEWLFPRMGQLNNGTAQRQTLNRNISLLIFDLRLFTLVNNKLRLW